MTERMNNFTVQCENRAEEVRARLTEAGRIELSLWYAEVVDQDDNVAHAYFTKVEMPPGRALLIAEFLTQLCSQDVPSVPVITDADIQEVFRKIAAGERKHGDFLTCFAEAYTRADFGNKPLLRDAALLLIEKYKIAGYATEPAITTFPPER